MEKILYIFGVFIACTKAVPLDIPSSLTRIANGNQVTDGQFGYAVSIQSTAPSAQQSQTRGHKCGGVLVSYQHVLTAATCTYTKLDNGTIVSIDPAQHRVFAGTILTNDTSADRVRNIANFTRHPNFIAGPAHLNDIAIMTLQTPFSANIVSPISLPDNNFSPADFTSCVVAGWGYPQNAPSPNLSYASTYIYDQALCTSIYNPATNVPNIFSTMVCAASYNIISSSCPGDEGNGLVCDGTLTGITFLTNNCHASSFPELYTRVSNYTTWIRSVTGDASTFKPALFTLSLFIIITKYVC